MAYMPVAYQLKIRTPLCTDIPAKTTYITLVSIDTRGVNNDSIYYKLNQYIKQLLNYNIEDKSDSEYQQRGTFVYKYVRDDLNVD